MSTDGWPKFLNEPGQAENRVVTENGDFSRVHRSLTDHCPVSKQVGLLAPRGFQSPSGPSFCYFLCTDFSPSWSFKHHHGAQSDSELLIFLPLPSSSGVMDMCHHVLSIPVPSPLSLASSTQLCPGAILLSIPHKKPEDRVETLTYLHVYLLQKFQQIQAVPSSHCG